MVSRLDVRSPSLLPAVRYGIKGLVGFTFFDPGLSLIEQCDLPEVRESELMFPVKWYQRYHWANVRDAPQQRHIRIPVKGSFGKKYSQQVQLLHAHEEVPAVRVLSMFFILRSLVTGIRGPQYLVQLSETDEKGHHIALSGMGPSGFSVTRLFGHDYWSPQCCMAATRKSSALSP